MEPKKRNSKNNLHHEHPLPGEIDANQKKKNIDAHEQADKDMIEDAGLTAHNPNDDLDEGETARLGDNTDLV
jgi:hypothetical protein